MNKFFFCLRFVHTLSLFFPVHGHMCSQLIIELSSKGFHICGWYQCYDYNVTRIHVCKQVNARVNGYYIVWWWRLIWCKSLRHMMDVYLSYVDTVIWHFFTSYTRLAFFFVSTHQPENHEYGVSFDIFALLVTNFHKKQTFFLKRFCSMMELPSNISC